MFQNVIQGMPDELYAEDLRQAAMVLSSARDLLQGRDAAGEIELDRVLAHGETICSHNLIDPERLSRAVDFINAIGMQFGMLEGMARAGVGTETTKENE